MRTLFLALSLLLAATPALALFENHTLRFSALRDGNPFGRHEVTVKHDGPRTEVSIRINLEVGLGPITLFRYDHENNEVWENGRLVSLTTTTNDNGDSYWVKGRATKDGFAVEGSSGNFIAPANIMPTSYWQQRMVEETSLLDTQYGRLVQLNSEKAGYDHLKISGKKVKATRYDVKGDLSLTVWYDENGRWVKLSFPARGSRVDYQLLSDASQR